MTLTSTLSFQSRLQFHIFNALSKALSLLPMRWTWSLGKMLGLLAYYAIPRRRKITLHNVAIASTLGIPQERIPSFAKQHFMSLGKILLESFAIYSKSDCFIQNYYQLQAEIEDARQTAIQFVPHMGNWEGLFQYVCLNDITKWTVARKADSEALDTWLLAKRTQRGGKVILKEGTLRRFLKPLKEGHSLSLLADQSHTIGNFYLPLLGAKATHATTPAVFARLTGLPVRVSHIRWKKDHWDLHFSSPIYPNQSLSKQEDIERMMQAIIKETEKAILASPAEWFWSHNRWKLPASDALPRKMRGEDLLIIFPHEEVPFSLSQSILSLIKNLYPHARLHLCLPTQDAEKDYASAASIQVYRNTKELFFKNYAIQIVFDLSNTPNLGKHFLKQSATFAQSFESPNQLLTLLDGFLQNT